MLKEAPTGFNRIDSNKPGLATAVNHVPKDGSSQNGEGGSRRSVPPVYATSPPGVIYSPDDYSVTSSAAVGSGQLRFPGEQQRSELEVRLGSNINPSELGDAAYTAYRPRSTSH